MMAIVSSLQSCDPYSRGYICNDSDEEFELLLLFDYDPLGQMSKKEVFSHFNDQIDSNAILLRVDTTSMTSMIGYYKLKSKTCALIGQGLLSYPTLDFNHLQIRSNSHTWDFPKVDEDVKKFFKKEEGFKLGFGGDYYLKLK